MTIVLLGSILGVPYSEIRGAFLEVPRIMTIVCLRSMLGVPYSLNPNPYTGKVSSRL